MCCTLKATEELGRALQVSRGKAWLCYWTVQEAQPWTESQAIGSSLQLPVATFLWWRNAIASSQNLPAPFLVSAADVNVWGHFKETVWNKEDEDTKELFSGLQCDSRSVFLKHNRYFYLERTGVPDFTIQQSIFFQAWRKGKCSAFQMHINEVVSFLLILGEALVLKERETFTSSTVVILFRWKCHLLRSCYNCNKG